MCILICASLHCTNSINKLEVQLVSRPLYIQRQRSAICSSGFCLTHWGYLGSAQRLGCEAQFLWLQPKPRKETCRVFLHVWLLSSYYPVSSRSRSRNHGSKIGVIFLCTSTAVALLKYQRVFTDVCWSFIFDGIRPCLGMNMVWGKETWMKGNENWQS